jgi:hypothetical protein
MEKKKLKIKKIDVKSIPATTKGGAGEWHCNEDGSICWRWSKDPV